MNIEESTDFVFVAEAERLCFDTPWSKESVREAMSSETGVTVVRTFGYALGKICGTEAELHRIGVLPEHRGQRVGKGILSEFIGICKARGVEKIYLEVGGRNIAARRLYRSAGFKRFCVRKNYYGDDDGECYELGV
jgi:ribosomal-protein-alanine N-acetyltransferase